MFFNNSINIAFTKVFHSIPSFEHRFFFLGFFLYQLNFSLLSLESSVTVHLVYEFLAVPCPFSDAVNAGYCD